MFSLHPEFGDTFPVNPNQFSSIVIAGAIWIAFFFLQCQAGFIKIFCWTNDFTVLAALALIAPLTFTPILSMSRSIECFLHFDSKILKCHTGIHKKELFYLYWAAHPSDNTNTLSKFNVRSYFKCLKINFKKWWTAWQSCWRLWLIISIIPSTITGRSESVHFWHLYLMIAGCIVTESLA